ncbi:Dabb family protein [Geodermatophilus sp. URMC 60]
MIRNVVVGRVRPGTDPALVQEALDAIVALPVEGLVDVRVGLDAGLRPGAWSFAITSDFVDAGAYRAYDTEAEHNRIRREMFDPVCEEIARVQFSA